MMVITSDIFELQQLSKDKAFLIKNSELELDVLAEILQVAADWPFIGSLIKLGKVGLNVIDLRYVKKLGKFLIESEQISEDKKEKFLSSLGNSDKKRISEFVSHLLYVADEDRKAELMGKIYRYRLLDKINNEQLLRLCSIVNRAFFDDFASLDDFIEESERTDYVTDNLSSLGLLQDCGNVHEENSEGWESIVFSSTKHKLNSIGRLLLDIIKDNPITLREDAPVKKVAISQASDEDIDSLF